MDCIIYTVSVNIAYLNKEGNYEFIRLDSGSGGYNWPVFCGQAYN